MGMAAIPVDAVGRGKPALPESAIVPQGLDIDERRAITVSEQYYYLLRWK